MVKLNWIIAHFLYGHSRALYQKQRPSFAPYIVAIVVTDCRSGDHDTVNHNFGVRCMNNSRDAIFCRLLFSQRPAWPLCSFRVQASIGLLIDT